MLLGNTMGDHQKMAGEWELVSQTNFAQLLEKFGIGFVKRKIAVAAQTKVCQTISFEGNNMTVFVDSPAKSKKNIPLDGSDFSEEMFEKTVVASATANEDGSITVKGKVCDQEMITVRKIDGAGNMILITTFKGVECIRVFSRK